MLCVEPGEKLKLARRYHQPALKQRELADILRVDTSTVGRWESRNEIPDDKIPVLSGLFNVIESWWKDGSDKLPIEVRRVPPVEPPNVSAKHPLDATKAEERVLSDAQYLIPVWRGAAAGSDEECYFPDETEEVESRPVPALFITGDPERFVLCIAKGMSMYPRIQHTERMLVRLDPDVSPGNLVVVRNPEGKNYIKRLVRKDGKLELHSLNDAFAPITKVDGWIIKGGITVIWHTYEPGRPNIEWNEGAYLQ